MADRSEHPAAAAPAVAPSPGSGSGGSGSGAIFSNVGDLLRLAWPVVVARASFLTMGMVDAIMVGRYSADQLAYHSLGLVPQNIVIVFGMGLLMGTMILSANRFGAGDYAACGRAWRHSLPYAVLIGIASAVFCFAGEPFLRLTGQSEELAEAGGAVAFTYGFGMPFAFLFMTTTYFLEGIKRVWPGMLVMVAANLVNVVANYALVYGAWGFPELGAVGSAWATNIVRVVQTGLLIGYVWHMAGHQRFGVRVPTGERFRDWAEQRRLGYAAGASLGLENLAFAILILFAGLLGALSVAAFSLTFNFFGLCFMVALGISTATAVRVGIATGENNPVGVAMAGWTGLGVNTAVMLVLSVFMFMFADAIAGLYTTETALKSLAAGLLGYAAFILVLDGNQTVMANALRGRGEKWVPTGMHFFSYILVMLGTAAWLAFETERAVYGLFDAVLIASVLSLSLVTGYFWWLGRRDRQHAQAYPVEAFR